jgi:hypothetical protein
LLVTEKTEYQFYLQADEGARFWIDDHLIVDHWGNRTWIPGRHGAVRLEARQHRIRIEHYDSAGNAAMRLRWTGGGIPANTVLGTPQVRKPRE